MTNSNAYVSRIEWAPNKLNKLPISETYSTAARFHEHLVEWENEAWSLVIRFTLGLSSGPVWYGYTQFLVPYAPEDYLHIGARFDLMEGREVAATGVVVTPKDVPTKEYNVV